MEKSSSLFSKTTLRSLFFIFSVYTALLVACSDEPEPEIEETEGPGLSCLPIKAKKLDANVFDYTYDGNNKLTKFELSGGTFILDRYSLEYEGDVVRRVVVDHVHNQEPGPKYEIIYGDNGRPSEVHYYFVSTDAELHTRIVFTHDNSGRIVTKEYYTDGVWKHTMRYEYNSAGNVAKKFITKIGKAEYLATEFLSYDDKKRFFSASPELTLLELYLFDYEPSINNVLKQLIYADVSTTYTPYLEVDFTVSYDENNYVKSLNNQDGTAANTILFLSMQYQCE